MGLLPKDAPIIAIKKALFYGFLIKGKQDYLIKQTVILTLIIEYQVLGIASVVAVAKGRGFGRELMIGMKQYIHQSGMTAVGFCAPEVLSFYAKCGHQILAGEVSRFRFMGEDGQELPPDHPGDDVLYLDYDGLMASVVRYPDDLAIAHRATW